MEVVPTFEQSNPWLLIVRLRGYTRGLHQYQNIITWQNLCRPLSNVVKHLEWDILVNSSDQLIFGATCCGSSGLRIPAFQLRVGSLMNKCNVNRPYVECLGLSNSKVPCYFTYASMLFPMREITYMWLSESGTDWYDTSRNWPSYGSWFHPIGGVWGLPWSRRKKTNRYNKLKV